MEEKLHIKYRPTSFKQVIGQDSVVKSLQASLEKQSSRVFLLHGPSGCGKTTLARICANKLGCATNDILEVDAATNTGVDDIRQLQEKLAYAPLLGSGARAVILDEAHMLSRSAWNSLLKTLEDTPRHVAWFLCTTEPGKVPPTIKNRSFSYSLKSVSFDDLKKLVKSVVKKEGLSTSDAIIDVVVGEAEGSPRKALVNLGMCAHSTSTREASQVLETAIGSADVMELIKLLLDKSASWPKAMKIVQRMEENPESIRIVTCNYVAAILVNSKSKGEAQRLLAILEAFRTPYNQSEKKAPLLLSLGELLM